MRTWAVFLVLGLLLSGCGTAAASGAFDYLYPDSPKAAKTPVSVPIGGTGPWQLSYLADHGVFDRLSHVVAAADDDVWAFGTGDGKPFAIRGDGRAWTPSPLPADAEGAVMDVAASGPGDVWLIAGKPRDPTAFRWDGRSWAVQEAAPYATGIEVLDATHVWAYAPGAVESVGFFDGSRWSAVPLPEGVKLDAFDATAPDELWMLGSSPRGGGAGLYRFDGHGWSRVPLGDALPADDRDSRVRLDLLVATARDDVWVIGSRVPRPEREDEVEQPAVPFAAHGDGRSWRPVAVPPEWRPRRAIGDGHGGLRVLAWPSAADPDAARPTTTILSLSPGGTSSTSAPGITGGRVSLEGLALGQDRVWAVGAAYSPEVTSTASTSVAYTFQ